MNKVWINITLIGSLIGIIILVVAITQLRKTLRKLNNVNDEEFFQNINVLTRKYIWISIFGLTITSIMQIIRLFLR